MGFVGKIAKTTENPENKYKLLKYSDLYLIFRRFSILFIDLITVHEVLPENLWVVHEKCAFRQVLRYLKKVHQIKIDPTGRDITRHCFMSFDPDIFLRKEFEPFNVVVNLSEESMSEIRLRYVSRKYPLPQKI